MSRLFFKFHENFTQQEKYWKYHVRFILSRRKWLFWGIYKWQWKLSLHHSSTISVWAYKEKKCGNESHEKETTETIVRRYSSKYVLLKILQESTCAKNNLSKRDQLYRKETLLKINFTNFKKETLTQVFFYKFCEIFMNTFFTEHLQWLLLKLNIPMLQLPIYYMLE